ncbi:YCF protein [Salix suchowensis]|nr:YCF protein [Salix suchowensis]
MVFRIGSHVSSTMGGSFHGCFPGILRQNNLYSGFLRTLDSSIKRNTAVIKKLKQINEEQREGLMEDLRNVNLSKFVSEAVTCICDAKLRTSDIQVAVQICSLLHQRYKDFSPSLVQGLLKVFFPGKSGEDLDVDKNSKAMKKRSTLKLLLELYFVGVTEDSSIFINIIKDLTSTENLKDRDNTPTNLTLLASFARQGRVFLGLPLSGQETQEEVLLYFLILSLCLTFRHFSTDQNKVFRKAFHTYYDGVAEVLQSEHASLRRMEHEDVKMFNCKGEPSDDNVSSYEKLRKSYDHLYRNVIVTEALDMQPPVMPEDGHTTRVTSRENASSSVAGKDTNALEALWDDEDTRAFYECLPNLRAFVPAVLLGEGEPKANEHSLKTQDQSNELATESDQGQPTQDMAEVSAESGTLQEGKGTEKGKDKEEKDKEKVKDPKKEKGKEKDPEKEKGKEKDAERKGENEKEKLKSLEGANLDALLQRLPGCVSRDLIDQLTVDFCYVNSKLSRKKLVRALFNVPRTSLELLPHYSRMVATLSTCMKDVSSMLLQMLEEEFNFLINKKDQMNIETKIRNIRFIGERCKFRIAPASTVFSCLKVFPLLFLLHPHCFTLAFFFFLTGSHTTYGHNLDIICQILDRFILYHQNAINHIYNHLQEIAAHFQRLLESNGSDILLSPAMLLFLSLLPPSEKTSSEGQYGPSGPAKKQATQTALKENFHKLLVNRLVTSILVVIHVTFKRTNKQGGKMNKETNIPRTLVCSAGSASLLPWQRW